MKKALSILLAMGMTVGMVAGCGDTADNSSAADNSAAASTEAGTDGTQAADIKVGVIYIGDENEGYTAAHMAGIDVYQMTRLLRRQQSRRTSPAMMQQ